MMVRVLPDAFGLLCVLALASAQEDVPPHRKSPELHALTAPDADGTKQGPGLYVFGGKGYTQEPRRRGGKGGKGKKGNKGGMRSTVTFFSDSWLFNLSSESWEEMESPKDSPVPTARWKSSMTRLDDSSLVLFGGCSSTATSGVMNDLWVLEASCCPATANWREVQTDSSPRARRGHVSVTNSTHLFIFGGKGWGDDNEAGECLTDIYSLPLSALSSGADQSDQRGNWTRGADFPGRCRWGATGTILNFNGSAYLAVFGGRILNPGNENHATGESAYTYFDELWLYDTTAASWRLAKPDGPGPHRRDHHGAASIGDDLFVFGGRDSETRDKSSVLNDLWRFSLKENQWTQLGLKDHGPSKRYMPGVAEIRNPRGVEVLAVFGGEQLPGSTKRTTLNDLWFFTPGTWPGWTLVPTEDDSSEEALELEGLQPQSQLEEIFGHVSGGLGGLGAMLFVIAALAGVYVYKADLRRGARSNQVAAEPSEYVQIQD
eukprot:CAMPEP_0170614402 /NCGR_PEP_ID=MMETSP0224-20130122/24782_1 /TAXON_ID=285029 /ORGANISM="Togula jolla, Strain CCCM 725" /LENGTH=488 /DNA_ID=CAMNT_0010940059 /DNA_START=50 /DNA_END=1516 /DNA_ORIENTATION=-